MKSDLKFFKKSKILPVDKFFRNVLYDNKFGYYTSRFPFGQKGDFVTSPKISNLFSEIIAIWIIASWELFGKPKNFNNLNFISKKFFLDAELMILFSDANLNMQSISLKYKIYKNSTIKIFSLQNFIYLAELFKVILRYKFKKTKKIKF